MKNKSKHNWKIAYRLFRTDRDNRYRRERYNKLSEPIKGLVLICNELDKVKDPLKYRSWLMDERKLLKREVTLLNSFHAQNKITGKQYQQISKRIGHYKKVTAKG